MIKTLKYQQKAINELTNYSIEALQEEDSKIIIFQAPTGAWKTIMMWKVIEDLANLADEEKIDVCFIRISVNSLHEQSKESLERVFEEERKIECISIQDITDKELLKNQTLFINWEKINKKDNLFVKENEYDWNLQSVIKNTKDSGTKIALIIDESHRTAKAVKSQELIKIIWPDLTIEVSATPKDTGSDHKVTIKKEKVIEEEMIKKEIFINPWIDAIKTNKDLIDTALRKRNYLKKMYEKVWSNINPLLLIQIPNKQVWSSVNPEDAMIRLVEELGITRANGKLAIKVADKDVTTNWSDIEMATSPVDVLIFKQAVALWWDCPRAHILVLQREWSDDSYEFNMQTLGRIMRMPEHKHYICDDLNVWYVYTATTNFEIVEDLAKDYATSTTMKRDDRIYKNIILPSENPRRKREITRLSGNFKELFVQVCEGSDFKKEINANIIQHTSDIWFDGKVLELDKHQKVKFEGQSEIYKSEEQVFFEYTRFLTDCTTPYAKSDSTAELKTAMRAFFKNKLWIDNDDNIANIVMNPNNTSRFEWKIEEAKDLYKNLPKKDDEILANPNWQVPEFIWVEWDFEEYKNTDKSIMKPFYLKKDKNWTIRLSEPERIFVDTVLEKSSDYLTWWYKNGERDTKYFGLCYSGDSQQPDSIDGFYPDFILRTKKETIIVEIKDDKGYNNQINCLKYQRGIEYMNTQQALKNNVWFFMLSPKDYKLFLKHLDEMKMDKFTPSFHRKLDQTIDGFKQMNSDLWAFEAKSEYKKLFNWRWDKLEPNTKAYLLTAEINYLSNKGNKKYNFNGDDLIKSLELELRMKLFEDMRNDDVGYDIIDELEKRSASNKKTIDYFNLKNNELTLGAIEILLTFNESVKKYIHTNFPSLSGQLKFIVTKIKTLREWYRNESAHWDKIITEKDYQEIVNILLWKDEVLIKIIKDLSD